MDDPFDLARFVAAQEPVFHHVLHELRQGTKRSHWMWFVFPQLAGLGSSEMAAKYAISGRPEATAYLEHPLLGTRLHNCTQLVIDIEDRSINAIFGYPDFLKFHSSLTLFSKVTPAPSVYLEAIQKYFGGEFDPATLSRIGT